ncbi:hypothetical protein SO802_021525 [Lithocarpus litseifolius]|uniref:Uncharacterized protein n=1 Tax=Lithocarpus litseifolius TaxID=425828 RepID=A0AAW2CI23_9ROSI
MRAHIERLSSDDNSWAGVPPAETPDLEASAVVVSGITQHFEGAGLRVLYLAERVHCQLVGEDALLSMTYAEMPLLLVFPLILLICLGWSMLTALMVFLGSVPCLVIPMSWVTLFRTAHGRPLSKSKKLVWLAGNLKLEVTQYSKDLYGLEGLAYPGNDDDDDGDGDSGEDSEASPN